MKNHTLGMIVLFLGVLIIAKAEVVIYSSAGNKLTDLNYLTHLDSWFGYVFAFIGTDLIFDEKISKVLFDKLISPFIRAILENLLGKERLDKLEAKLEARLKRKPKEEKECV